MIRNEIIPLINISIRNLFNCGNKAAIKQSSRKMNEVIIRRSINLDANILKNNYL